MHMRISSRLAIRFSSAVTEFEAENNTIYQIKKSQRVQGFFDRRIAQDKQRIRTLREAGRDPRVIRAAEGRLQRSCQKKGTAPC